MYKCDNSSNFQRQSNLSIILIDVFGGCFMGVKLESRSQLSGVCFSVFYSFVFWLFCLYTTAFVVIFGLLVSVCLV